MNIAIVGTGNVGATLGRTWAKAGHVIIFGVRDPAAEKGRPSLGDIGSSAAIENAVLNVSVIVLATPWGEVPASIEAMGDIRGKIVVDTTNPLMLSAEGGLGLSVGASDSGAEEIARLAAGTRVVKAFNTYGWENLADSKYPAYGDLKPAMFYCGDDDDAKEVVAKLTNDLGFDPVDVGGLAMARSLEPLALLWIQFAVERGRNPNFAWAMLKR